jgi:YVTN family beta-propeller protein
VAVIDGPTDSVVAFIRLGDGPSALCYDSLSNRLYCATEEPSVVHVIDCATNQVLDTIRVGYDPSALCVNRQGTRLYCANGRAGTVSVIDCVHNQLRATIAVSEYASAVSHSPVDDIVFCAGGSTTGQGWVAVIDGVRDTLLDVMPVPLGQLWLWSNPNNGLVYGSGPNSSCAVALRGGAAVEEGPTSPASIRSTVCTIVRGVLFLAEAPSHQSRASSGLLDVSGRQVMALHPGPNDVRALAPGVYFVQERLAVGGERSAVSKVVLAP